VRMPPRMFVAAAALCALFAASFAQASQESKAPDEIIVTGERLTPKEERARAVSFVTQSGVAVGETPMTRWVDRVCVKVEGIKDEYAAIVQNKIFAVATAASIPFAQGKCDPNILIQFTEDADGFAKQIRKKAPSRAAAALTNGALPVRWWHRSGTRDADNRGGAAGSPGFASVGNDVDGGVGMGIPVSDSGGAMTYYDPSIISTRSIRALNTALVVVDTKKAEGVPLSAIAAYIAMVSLAEISPKVPSVKGSILSLFDQPGTVRNVTEWDIAFLRGIYSVPLDRKGRQHRGLLVGRLLKEMRKQDAR
jgi:hypothetical protein